jgi:hypothetical protein
MKVVRNGQNFSLFIDGFTKLSNRPRSVLVKTLKLLGVKEPNLMMEIMEHEGFGYMMFDKNKIIEGGCYGTSDAGTRQAA